ncbi:hypothetical protein MtrunA17_Chr1g0148471 [Medicago truncatula]|uniref:Transmembrane protein n=1 Tax=Medicago truncatula TaxID=3880 RepID=A0A396JF99_MEDTR|nr:hypothetical protein MtrunA17_Chr1g0148471 [Medicago truncatula]
MNCSIWLSSIVLDFLIATILLSSSSPLKTVPKPPLPMIKLSSKLLVAFLSSFSLKM